MSPTRTISPTRHGAWGPVWGQCWKCLMFSTSWGHDHVHVHGHGHGYGHGHGWPRPWPWPPRLAQGENNGKKLAIVFPFKRGTLKRAKRVGDPQSPLKVLTEVCPLCQSRVPSRAPLVAPRRGATKVGGLGTLPGRLDGSGPPTPLLLFRVGGEGLGDQIRLNAQGGSQGHNLYLKP